MNTKEYLNEVKRVKGIESDYKLAKYLGITKQAISGYQQNNRVMDDYTAAKIAKVLGIPEIQVIADANAEREKTEERRDFWRKIAEDSRSRIAAMLLIMVGVYIWTDAFNIDSYYTLCAVLIIFCMAFLFARHRSHGPA